MKCSSLARQILSSLVDDRTWLTRHTIGGTEVSFDVGTTSWVLETKSECTIGSKIFGTTDPINLILNRYEDS